MTIRICHVSELESIFILIGAWQVLQNGDGFEVIYWKFLTGAVEGNVKPCAGMQLENHLSKFSISKEKAACHLQCTSAHKGGFDQELCCTPDVKHIHQVDIWLTRREKNMQRSQRSFYNESLLN